MNPIVQSILLVLSIMSLLILPAICIHHTRHHRRTVTRRRLLQAQLANTRPLLLPLFQDRRRDGTVAPEELQVPGPAVMRDSVIYTLGTLNVPPIILYNARES
ncbi:hypothetical protein L218DRAFT_162732 [Marasmius fiardii PR-910]|nr:hypothetical protein L218DRAFT_162732 [Marasmius fiardii PR-910]